MVCGVTTARETLREIEALRERGPLFSRHPDVSPEFTKAWRAGISDALSSLRASLAEAPGSEALMRAWAREQIIAAHDVYHDSGMCYEDSHAEYQRRIEAAPALSPCICHRGISDEYCPAHGMTVREATTRHDESHDSTSASSLLDKWSALMRRHLHDEHPYPHLECSCKEFIAVGNAIDALVFPNPQGG